MKTKVFDTISALIVGSVLGYIIYLMSGCTYGPLQPTKLYEINQHTSASPTPITTEFNP